MAKHAHSFTEAHEMETLKEGTWYIRGCEELGDYFKKNNIRLYGDCEDVGSYIEDGKWGCDDIEDLQHRTEITLQDYLDSLKPQSFDELDSEIEEKEKGSIEFLKSRGYLIPKLFDGGEGENKCCDNPDIQWNKIEISIGDKQGTYKDLNFNFCDNCGETFNEAFD